jgi:MtN3 and saliva related transmembrane protein
VDPAQNEATAQAFMMDITTATGILAACCTTASYFPQLKKCWETQETGDLSLGMFLTLLAGISLWVAYGVLRSDPVILIANAISVCLLAGILFFKLKEMAGDHSNP